MTSDQPKQPKPNKQQFWQQIQPVLKTQSLRALRTTIQLLEGVVEELEKIPEPTSDKLSSPSEQSVSKIKAAPVERVVSPTVSPDVPAVEPTITPGEISPTLEPVGETESAEVNVWDIDEISLDEQPDLDEQPALVEQPKPQEAIAPPPLTRSPIPLHRKADTPLPAAQGSLWAKWVALLDWLRDRLPDSLSDRLSDSVLTSITAGVLVLLVWTTSALLPKQAEEVAQAPPVQPSPLVKPTPSPQPIPPKQVSPAPEKPVVVNPPTPKPKPTPSPIPSPPPAPPPPLELSPEQSLIAAIQDQVTEVTNRYANGLIQSIQANFRESRLIVKVSMGWYELSGDRQNKLADEMLQRAQDLDFSKLEITDAQGTLLARSPVVGPNMIILQRAVKTDQAA